MDIIQNIEKKLETILANKAPKIDGPVYLCDEVILAISPEIGHSLVVEIDTRVAKKLAIVCGCAVGNNLQIVVTGLNSASGNIPVIMNTIELNTETPTGGYVTTELFPFTQIAATNLDKGNAGVLTVSYVLSR
jgi:hypothetical protein